MPLPPAVLFGLIILHSFAASGSIGLDYVAWDTIRRVVDKVVPVSRARVLSEQYGRRVNSKGLAPRRWLFGSYHKSGTALLNGLVKSLAKQVKLFMQDSRCKNESRISMQDIQRYQIHLRCNLKIDDVALFSEAAGTDQRIVHIIRDPVRLVVSAYVYHTYRADGPFSRSTSPSELRSLPVAEGVERIATFAISAWLKDMVNVYTSKYSTRSFTLEQFTDSITSFDAAVESFYDYIVGDLTDAKALAALRKKSKRLDLNRFWTSRKTAAFGADHASSLLRPNLTQLAASAVEAIPVDTRQTLYAMRKALDYE